MRTIREIDAIVITWAREHYPDVYNYSSRHAYYRLAVAAGIVSADERDRVRAHYGDRFDYTGD